MVRATGIALLAVWIAVPAARASIEEFESWDLGAREGDDEYGLDAYFLSFSPEWESDWMYTEDGARSSMGSSVNEVWEMRNEIRLHRDLGPHMRFRYSFLQNQGLTIDDEQHSLGFEVERGGFWFGPFARPNTDKEHLDAGLVVSREWADHTLIRLSYGFEDWNSDHTNGRSTVPGRTTVDFIDPAREWRVEARRLWSEKRWVAVEGAWLQEFRRNVVPGASGGEPFTRHTGGNFFEVHGVVDPLPQVKLALHGERKESRVADYPDTGLPTDLRRDAWRARAHLTHPLHAGFLGRWGLERSFFREDDVAGTPIAYDLDGHDTTFSAGVRRRLASWFTMEGGYGHQSTTIDQTGAPSTERFTWGTRRENRLYFSFEFETQGLNVRLIETIELDDEGYDAISDHDKGFLQLQASF